MELSPLPPLPATPIGSDGWSYGRWAGELRFDPVGHGQRHGRVRRWMYAAAGDGELAVGAAVVDLGIVAVAFAWLRRRGELFAHEVRRPLRWGATVGSVPGDGASLRAGSALVELGGDGAMHLDVPTDGGRLRAVLAAGPVTPIVLMTGTPDGGWNATQKAAGYAMTGHVALDADRHELVGAGWRDWTAGRQDRRTAWRWAAGGGRVDGRLVGFNVSTGMNATGAGEDVVWWDGQPSALPTTVLAPVADDPAGDWQVTGPGWGLHLHTAAVRAADERLGPLASRYVQPVGTAEGTLLAPDGTTVAVAGISAVAEDHEARW